MHHFVRPTPLTDILYEYALTVGLREPDVFRELREETSKLADREMQIAPEQGSLLAMLVQLLGARNCLEIGTFTGYSALWVASALPPEGKLICCDVSEEFTALARTFWKKAGVAEKIDLRLGPALATLDQLRRNGINNHFDFAFIDADKINYDSYYETCLDLIRPGGLIAIDNTLWDGKVADANVNDTDTVAIRNLNEKIHSDHCVSLCFLPFADGMTLALKR